MKSQSEICLVAIITLLHTLILVTAYGTSTGRGSTTPPPENDNEQWGGIGHGQHGGRPVDNYGQSGQQNSGGYDNDFQEANFFTRPSHVERYGYPVGCVHERDPRNICNYYVEIAKEPEDPTTLHFELSTRIQDPDRGGYVAVGLSKDQFMGEDHMVECIKLGDGTTRAYQSWATGRTQPNRLRDDSFIIGMDDTYPKYDIESKILTCKFRRPIITHVEVPGRPPMKFDLERGKYYVLLAVGPTSNVNSDKLGYHGSKPLETGDAYVSPNLLGHSEEKFPEHGTAGYNNNGSSGQVVGSCSVVFIFTLFMLFY